MAVETATYIGQLNAAFPAGGEPIAQGDDHLRLIKTVLQNSFPGLNSAWSAGVLPFTPVGGIQATNVQAAIAELDTEKAALAGATFTGSIAAPYININGGAIGYDSLWLGPRQIRREQPSNNIEVVNAANNLVTHVFYDDGAILSRVGVHVGATRTAGTAADGSILGVGTIELRNPSPFIDFKTSDIDYRYRIILQNDNLQIHAPNGAFRVGASGECYSSLTASTADALTRKDYVDGQIASRPFADTCMAVGFSGGNVGDPYIRHSNQTIVSLVKSCNNSGWLGMSTGNRCEFHWNSGLYAQVDGATGWFAIQNSLGSDRRLKEPAATEKTQSGLATVMALNPVYFEYKENSLAHKPGARWGFYAQELQEVDASLVTSGKIPEDETEYLFYAEDGLAQLIAIQTRAIQELSTKLDAALTRIAALEAA